MEYLLGDNLLRQFTEYAITEGSNHFLTIDGLKSLLQNRFAQYLKDSFSIDNIIKSMDKNNDGRVSFEEFVILIKKITGQ